MNWFSKFKGKGEVEAPKDTKELENKGKGNEAQAEQRDAEQEKLANFEQRVDAAEASVIRKQAIVDSLRVEMQTISERLDEFDPEWKQGEDGFSRDSGQDMDEGVVAFKKLYKEKAEAFSAALEELNEAQREYAIASNHLKALAEFGVDLTERSATIRDEMAELRSQLEQADAVMTVTDELRPRLDVYTALNAEAEAIGLGEWNDNESWLPEDAAVPEFMPNFRKDYADDAKEGTYKPSAEKNKAIEDQQAEREKMADLNERMGVDRDAF